MKCLLLFVISAGFVCSLTAQNPTFARSYFENAIEAYGNKEYGKTLSLLEQSKQYAGSTNPDIIYLEIKTRLLNDLNINPTKELIQQFMRESFIDDERRAEVSKLFVDIESSDNYFENGIRKNSSFTNESGNKCIVHYNNAGWVQKTICYENQNSTTVVKGVYFKAPKVLDREELFFADATKNKITFYEDNKRKLEIIAGNDVFIYNGEGKMVQAYSLKEDETNTNVDFVHVGLFQASTYNPETDFNASHEISIVEVFPLSTTVPVNLQQRFTLGMVKKAKRVVWDDKGEWEIYEFDQDGTPLKKSYFKRAKLRDTYRFNNRTKEWVKK